MDPSPGRTADAEAWPVRVPEEDRARALVDTAARVRSKYGELKTKRVVNMTLPEVVEHKLRVTRVWTSFFQLSLISSCKPQVKRAYFDSGACVCVCLWVGERLRSLRLIGLSIADYFRECQGLRDVPALANHDKPSCIWEFTRDDSGALVRASQVPFSPRTLKATVAEAGGVNLHGVLEYPLGTQPYPIALAFSGGKVTVVAHPSHSETLEQESIRRIATQADHELKRKYGTLTPSTGAVLSLKLKGHKPHDKKADMFDSADWALTLGCVQKAAADASKKE